jgi:hypothetical protein
LSFSVHSTTHYDVVKQGKVLALSRKWVARDVNPSSAVGILGTAVGLKGIPGKWKILRDLPIENRAIREIYPAAIEWDDIIEVTVEVGMWNILQHGGFLEKGVFNIPWRRLRNVSALDIL